MKRPLLNLVLAILAVAPNAVAQDMLSGLMTLGGGDVAAIRQRAEAGDSQSQVALANAYSAQFHYLDASRWFREAAQHGNIEGAYQLGHMLLFGSHGIPPEQSVQASPAEGLRWTYMAATNFHARACCNMGRALQRGVGATTNLVEAYAWFSVAAGGPQRSGVGRLEMNQLALMLDSGSLQGAERVAARFRNRQWLYPLSRSGGGDDPRFKVNGITFGGKTPLAIINGATLAKGESATVKVDGAKLTIKCLEIEKYSVVVTVEGEEAPRTLRLK